MNAPQRAFKGVWIPAEIWDSEDLTWMEKCLLAEVNSLDDGNGCWAGNDFLAAKFKTTAGNIAKILSGLRSSGFIKTVKFDGRTRWISVCGEFTKREGQGLRNGQPSVYQTANPEAPCYIEEKQTESIYPESPIKPPSAEKETKPKLSKAELESKALEIYKTYPKKVSKVKALQAIIKALQIHEFDRLLERTSKYAQCVANWPEDQLCFVPNPASWFNGGNFDDDERVWIRKAPGETFNQMSQRAFAIRSAIQTHIANREFIGAKDDPTDAEIAQLRGLRAQLLEIENKMALSK